MEGREEKGSVSREIDDEDLIHGLLQAIDTVKSFGEYRRTQKKACLNLIRRMKLIVPFLEDVRDRDTPMPDSVYERLCSLTEAFNLAQKLSRCCHDGSKIYLVRFSFLIFVFYVLELWVFLACYWEQALEMEAVMGRFRSANEKLSQAFEGMPYDELGISDEVKELVIFSRFSWF